MKRYFIVIMSLICICVPTAAQTDNDLITEREDPLLSATSADSTAADSILPWPQNVQAKITDMLGDRMFDTSQIGIMVYDLTADSAIFRHNERQTMRPASTMKVLTAITAIDRLGGSYRFRTSLYHTGVIENRTLTGDIWCVGGFDPLFNSDDMNAFVESILQMGVDTIRGRIVADKSMKHTLRYGEGWCWDDDNPVLSPLLISRKDRFAERFVEELESRGVTVEAELAQGRLPNGAFIVCSRFHTIDQVLIRMMKDSDNLFAEAMFYQIASATGNTPAKASHARTAIRKLISRIGLDAGAYRIADGSGLSLYNYVSAELEVGMLRYAFRNNEIFVHLYPSMAIAGEDGTLKGRMRGGLTSGNVHAKTGTLTGISSLAGYCTASNGHTLCFAIINQGVMQGRSGRAFHDRVCTVLCEP